MSENESSMRLPGARNQCPKIRYRKFYRFGLQSRDGIDRAMARDSPLTKVEVPDLAARDTFHGVACSILFGEELSWKYIS